MVYAVTKRITENVKEMTSSVLNGHKKRKLSWKKALQYQLNYKGNKKQVTELPAKF